MRSRVTNSGTSLSAIWVVTKTMCIFPEDCIIAKSFTPHTSAINSVCPVKSIPARLTAYLFMGAVTIASIRRARQSSAAFFTLLYAARPQTAEASPILYAPGASSELSQKSYSTVVSTLLKASSIIIREPYRINLTSCAKRFSATARASSSGPIPAGSPIVRAMLSLFITTTCYFIKLAMPVKMTCAAKAASIKPVILLRI